MGTFHQNKGDLHGITVVVDTHGPQVFIGRCDTETPEGIYLMDADEHSEAESGPTKSEYVARAAQVGVWKKHDRIVIPREQIASVRRLGEV